MYETVGQFLAAAKDAELRKDARAEWFMTAVEAIPYVSDGHLHCVEPMEGLWSDPDQDIKLYRPDQALGDSALTLLNNAVREACLDFSDEVEFRSAISAAKIEITKARLYCAFLNEGYFEQASALTPLAVQSHAAWRSDIQDVPIVQVGNAPLVLIIDPCWITPRGTAGWLADWLDYRYRAWNSFVSLRPGAEEVAPAVLLAAAAVAWLDAAFVCDDAFMKTEALSVGSMALYYSAIDPVSAAQEAAERGRKGAIAKHRRTRELKTWALMEAKLLRGADMDIARQLEKRIPVSLRAQSADPARLIYDALRSARKGG